MNEAAEKLDPLYFPLYGERLIEASAGTGKTYTIIILYLRLLLKLGNCAAFTRPLRVEELLVLTFTEAATNELRNRIRRNIHDLRVACTCQSTDNPLYIKLLNQIDDKHQAAQWLLLAEQYMDNAAIFTIHSFCQRMLHTNAFEAGMLFKHQVIKDESTLLHQACIDFWRRNCYPLSREIAEIIHTQWKGPEELLKTINPYLQGEIPIIKSPPPPEETIIARHEKNIALINELKYKWRISAKNVNSVIENSGIDRQKFNRTNQAKWVKKISVWAEEKTCNYRLPKILEKFTQSFLSKHTKTGGVIPEHPLFVEIETLLTQPITINDLLITRAITEIRKTIAYEKLQRNELSFDDMLSYLDAALAGKNGEILAKNIRTRFPVVMIDEFQDTDQQQYRIFRHIWYQQYNTALIFIGDPKQAIYTFRGADIFTYMKARKEVKSRYTLSINWRSAPGIVESVNTLFQRMENAFLFQEIPFLPIKSAIKNADRRFEYKGKTIPAMKLCLMKGECCSVSEYQIYMAKHCASQICNYLNASLHNEALLWFEKKSRAVKASDITILVRNSQEAELIRNELALLNIPSVYYSDNSSVFETIEAQEIFWLLQAILSPEQENTLRWALTSSFLNLNAHDIDTLNNNAHAWDIVVEEFSSYRDNWQKYGVMSMLRKIMTRRHIAENMLATMGGERRLTNILHISELLQEVDSKLKNQYALIQWLNQNIINPSNNITNQLIRLENDKHLVQITTIHKSKGLEYPLVWIPFIANYRMKHQAFYHDPLSFNKILDLSESNKSLKLAKIEHLAEDLRLLYVALTRPIWHCSIGIAPICLHKRKKIDKSDFHQSALGYLIQQGKPKNANGLYQCLQSLCNTNIALCIPDISNNASWQTSEILIPDLEARRTKRSIIKNNWQLTSYSALQQHETGEVLDLIYNKPKINIDEHNSILQTVTLTPHQFPRGSRSGVFLHNLFEALDFTQPVPDKWVLEMLEKHGYETYWQPIISTWITAVLHAQLTEYALTLHQLDAKSKCVEMKFHLPIEETLTAKELDATIRSYDSISQGCAPLSFQQVHGMLKGFIDLVFLYNGRYYQLDYKSNWLGDNNESYTHQSILRVMQTHRYDLQYHLYTLALHRYLRHRLIDYNYETHFGCVIYLFLRGINLDNPQSGIFTTRPDVALINQLDKLFTGNRKR